MKQTSARLAAGALISATCLVAASPGGPLPWLMPWSLIPFLLGARRAEVLGRVAASLFVASTWALPIAAALFFRAPIVGVLLACVPTTILAACLLAASSTRLDDWKQLLLFAALWAAIGGALQSFVDHVAAWPLSAGIAVAFPACWPLIAVGGWPLLDLLLLGFGAIAWAGIRRTLSPEALVRAVGAGLMAVWLSTASCSDRVSSDGVVRLGLTQGDLPWSTLRTVAISPRSRAAARDRIFGLTRRAIESRPDVVVWPENGTGTPVGQIRADASAISEMAGRSRSIIVAPGDLLGPAGTQAVTWIFDGAEIDVIRKASPVPGVEDGDDHHDAPVFKAGDATLAVLLCYDSVVRRNVAKAVENGAEILLAPSDNSSFSATALTAWQIGASLVLAVEHGRSLVVVMNRGPSVLVDPIAGSVESLAPSGASSATAVDVPRARGKTIASSGGSLVALLGSLVLAGALLWKAAPAWWSEPAFAADKADASRIARRGLAILATACLGLAAGWIVRVIGAATIERRLPLGDGHDPEPEIRSAVMMSGRAFRQSTPESCGPAALSWVLFSLGDTVFEEQLREYDHRHSLAELSDLAAARGFVSRAFFGQVSDLSNSVDTGYVLHSGDDHFVGAFPREDGRIVVFDPAKGRVQVLRGEELAASWSGYGLELALPPVASGF